MLVKSRESKLFPSLSIWRTGEVQEVVPAAGEAGPPKL